MPRVLLIDDDPVALSVYVELFTSAGFEVRSAKDGEAGLAAFIAQRPHAVVLDLAMPKMNWLEQVMGYAVFKQLAVVAFDADAIAGPLPAAQNADHMTVLSKKDADPLKVVEAVNDAIRTVLRAA